MIERIDALIEHTRLALGHGDQFLIAACCEDFLEAGAFVRGHLEGADGGDHRFELGIFLRQAHIVLARRAGRHLRLEVLKVGLQPVELALRNLHHHATSFRPRVLSEFAAERKEVQARRTSKRPRSRRGT